MRDFIQLLCLLFMAALLLSVPVVYCALIFVVMRAIAG